jgi:Tol biopolymer transport system component
MVRAPAGTRKHRNAQQGGWSVLAHSGPLALSSLIRPCFAGGMDTKGSSPEDVRFESWKDIATYLNRGVTTVQRWEREEALPVRRLEHLKRGSVFAYKSEIDAWRAGRERPPDAEDPVPPGTLLEPAVPQFVAPGETHSIRWPTLLAAITSVGIVLTVLAASVFKGGPPTAAPLTTPVLAPRPIANDSNSETSATLSPDAQSVAYLWRLPSSPGIYIRDIAGGAPRRVDTGDFPFVGSAYLRWSPRGDQLAFLSGEEGTARGVFVVSPGGGVPRRLTSIAGIGLCWAPDGETLGFADRVSTADPFAIFLLSVSTGERSRLSAPSPGAFGDTLCAFAPDGRQVAVARFVNRYQADVMVISLANPARTRQLTTDFGGVNGITWTPDGENILIGAHSGLWTISATAERSTPILLAASGVSVHSPAAARDAQGATQIAFQSSVRDLNLYRWEGDARRTALFAASSAHDTHPAFSPDGARVAFVSTRSGFNEVWVATLDGTTQRLTHHDGPVLVGPQFSPDGHQIVYTSHTAGNRDVFVINVDGTRSRRLTWEPSQEDNPSWSRDGQWIYFRSDRGGSARLWKVASGGGDAIQVTRGEASQGVESVDGKTLYFVRSADTPGLWALPTTGGEERFVVGEVAEGFWDVAQDNIAFLTPWSEIAKAPLLARVFDLRTRNVSTLFEVPPGGGPLSQGFATSRDARQVVWTQYERMQNDVMLLSIPPR